jgi:predicted chitinase
MTTSAVPPALWVWVAAGCAAANGDCEAAAMQISGMANHSNARAASTDRIRIRSFISSICNLGF